MAFQKIPSNKIRTWLEANFEFKTRKDGEEYLIPNPLYNDEAFHLGINTENGICHDWHGDACWAGPKNPKTGKYNCSFINFVRLYLKCSYREALTVILGQKDARLYLDNNKQLPKEKLSEVEVSLPTDVEPILQSPGKQSELLLKWLYYRGYTDQTIKFYDLQCSGMDVYWPYYEFEELVYWQSRSRMNKTFRFPDADIYNDKREVIGKTAGSKGDFLYGFDDIKMESFIIVVEAIFGKISLGDQTLASGGALITDRQIMKLKLLNPKKGIILAPDNDAAGINSIISNGQKLKSLDVPIYYSTPPRIEYYKNNEINYTKDWNELITELKYPIDKIRDIMDSNIKPLTIGNQLLLRKEATNYNRIL